MRINTEFEITLTRVRGGSCPWVLRVTDSPSGAVILEVDLDSEQFSHLMSAHHFSVQGKLYQSDRHGKCIEIEHLQVTLPEHYSRQDVWDRFMEERTKFWKSRGWEVQQEEQANHHRVNKGQYSLTLRRWVDA